MPLREKVGIRDQLGGTEIAATVKTLPPNALCPMDRSVHRNRYPTIAVRGVMLSSAQGRRVGKEVALKSGYFGFKSQLYNLAAV